jgi:hypothetical protein
MSYRLLYTSFLVGIPLSIKFRLVLILSIFSAFSCLSLSAQDSYFANWFNRVRETQAEQPHWLTPMFTTTPRLEEEFRSDIVWTPVAGGDNMNYGAGKGLELIPTKQTEIILGVPPYQVPFKGPDGFGNIPLLLKYRFLTGNEEHGNCIVTAFLGGSIPYGRFASEYGSITPTIALGKGFHEFDFQSTLGWTIPTGGRQKSGTPVAYNTAFQYHVLRKLCLSPGLVAGRFHLWRRLGLSIGAGEQIAVTHFHQYNHAKTLSIRFPF